MDGVTRASTNHGTNVTSMANASSIAKTVSATSNTRTTPSVSSCQTAVQPGTENVPSGATRKKSVLRSLFSIPMSSVMPSTHAI